MSGARPGDVRDFGLKLFIRGVRIAPDHWGNEAGETGKPPPPPRRGEERGRPSARHLRSGPAEVRGHARPRDQDAGHQLTWNIAFASTTITTMWAPTRRWVRSKSHCYAGALAEQNALASVTRARASSGGTPDVALIAQARRTSAASSGVSQPFGTAVP